MEGKPFLLVFPRISVERGQAETTTSSSFVIRALLPDAPRITLGPMATITEVEKLALDLPEGERAVLAAHLLGSLPSVLHDEDEGIGEALRRDAELDSNPLLGISLEQLDRQIALRRS